MNRRSFLGLFGSVAAAVATGAELLPAPASGERPVPPRKPLVPDRGKSICVQTPLGPNTWMYDEYDLARRRNMADAAAALGRSARETVEALVRDAERSR